MVSMFPLVRRDSGDETLALISGRDSLRGTEEDPELHLILSDLIKELDQYYFLSLLSLQNIHTKKAFDLSSFTGLQKEHMFVFVRLFWDSLAYSYVNCNCNSPIIIKIVLMP